MSLFGKIRTVFTMGRGVTKGLPELTASDDPIAFFNTWFTEAKDAGILLPDAMTLATATPDGVPSARMMLLKGADKRGFAFFTNYESRKGRELTGNPKAAIVLHWPIFQRQVRAEGTIIRLSEDESLAYFRTRSRGSRIGAWASKQSSELSERGELEAREREIQAEYAGKDVPLPPFWGGFLLAPDRIEFWQGRLNRLHDRLRYEKAGDGWKVVRLYP
jgi:pyridoxamine 5'-phosphate oxidase